MDIPHYSWHSGEKLLLKASCVRHGFWAAYTGELVLTNLYVVYFEYGIFNNFKESVCYPIDDISQVMIGEAQNGEKQIELYHTGSVEDFAFQSGNERELRIWVMAIKNCLSSNKDLYDYDYYQRFYDENLIKSDTYADDDSDSDDYDEQFISDVAKSVLKSKNFSASGIMKSVAKASKKQEKRNAKKAFTKSIKDELGITDLEDEFTEMGNELREEFGLKPKMTQKALKEQRLNAAFEREVEKAQRELYHQKYDGNAESQKTSTSSIDANIETIKKLKELVEMGIITQEEFDLKKKQLLDL